MFGTERPDLSERNSNKIWTQEAKDAIKNKNSKKIKCLETQEIFSSVKEAGKILKIDPKAISLVARGLKNKIKGKTFVFIE